MRWAGTLFRWLLTIFLVGVAVQFFLAGLGVFKTQNGTDNGTVGDSEFASYFDPHRTLGNVLLIAGVVVFVAALLAKVGAPRIYLILALPILVALQSVFANSGPSWFRALHVLNAFVIAGIAGSQTGLVWQAHRATSVASPPD